jgi:hypothetical protein
MHAALAAWLTCATPVAFALGCGSHLPSPPLSPPRPAQEDLVDVPSAPPAGHVEFVPEQPHDDAVWVDGQWTYAGRWRWEPGGWLIVPEGYRFTPWQTFYRADGSIVLMPSSWHDAHGNVVDAPPFIARATPAHAAPEPETPRSVARSPP